MRGVSLFTGMVVGDREWLRDVAAFFESLSTTEDLFEPSEQNHRTISSAAARYRSLFVSTLNFWGVFGRVGVDPLVLWIWGF